MSFYISHITLFNRAPFSYQEFSFNRHINVLSGINGSGKTSVLSHIVDMLHELAKQGYPKSFENSLNNFYRIESDSFSVDKNKSSYVYIRFNFDDKEYDYIDCCSSCLTEEEYSKVSLNKRIDIKDINEKLKDNDGFVKYSSLDKENDMFVLFDNKLRKICANIFSSNVVTYFPAYRFELPNYLNDIYKFKETDSPITFSPFIGFLPNPIEVRANFSNIFDWILNVLLDYCLYEKFQQDNKESPLSKNNQDLFKNTVNQLNQIINIILKSKCRQCNVDESYKLQCGPRYLDKSRLFITDINNQIVVPNIFNLSSGELALLSIFCEIFRQADKLHQNISCKEICGIVIIDEIEKHLHIKLQYDVLPKLVYLFPNVQFVVSSHSPFFNMGLSAVFHKRAQLFDLDNNGIVSEPTNNKIYKEVYDLMVKENQRFADSYKELKIKVESSSKPVVITEGKTDWKHFKAALNYFKEQKEYEDIDIELLEYSFDLGDGSLNDLLNQYSKFHNRYKIIGIFDCDENNGREINLIHNGIKCFNNNIWGMSIPIPDFRKYNTIGISVEFLYKDDDLKRTDGSGRRIFVTSEFNINGRLKSDYSIGVKNIYDVKNYLEKKKEKIQAEGVISISGESLALSKENFALNILERKDNFTNVDFCAFRGVFDRLREIINTN